jgi:molybdate transport system ATP-binding protein
MKPEIESKHWTIFVSNEIDKAIFIKQLLTKNSVGQLSFLDNLVGVVFSEIILNEIINEENRFGRSLLVKTQNRDISTYSGGEQKKALLNHCLAQNCDFIVLDNPFDNLDIQSQAQILELLFDIAKEKIIIQLIQRQSEALNFITKKAILCENKQLNIFSFGTLMPIPTGTELNLKIFPEFSKNDELAFSNLVAFEAVSVCYDGKPILKNINWCINASEFWQLKGPNGAGKSTLLSLIIGDNPKAYGQNIKLFGHQKGSGESVAELKKNIGYFTPSLTSLFTRKTTVEHMVVSGIYDSIGLYKLPTERQIRLANEWLAIIELKALAKKEFFKITLGQQRLVMIARAMIKQPPLLILDEPMAGLDDDNALKVSRIINKIASEMDTAIIYVSHKTEPELAAKYVFELTPTANGSIGAVLMN